MVDLFYLFAVTLILILATPFVAFLSTRYPFSNAPFLFPALIGPLRVVNIYNYCHITQRFYGDCTHVSDPAAIYDLTIMPRTRLFKYMVKERNWEQE